MFADKPCTVMPVFSSGQTAVQVADTFAALGSTDLIHTAGGGILAHPDGPAAGVAGLREAWEAAMAGIPAAEYAKGHPALAKGTGGLRLMTVNALPDGLLVAYYGDDFTGSTSVMEVMTLRACPRSSSWTCRRTRRWRGSRATGASASPAWPAPDPAWMDDHLPPVFHKLAALGAPIAHYKVCSTLIWRRTSARSGGRSTSRYRSSVVPGARW